MWEYFQAGGPLMWPLLFCSIIAVAIILERSWFWRSLNLKKEEAVCDQIIKSLESGQKPDVVRPEGFLTAMLYAGMETGGKNSDKAMEAVALTCLARMRRGMGLLDTIITAAPMLGIMGTVLGIISSFDMLGQAGISEPKAVIGGIAQALITTAAGLGISVLTIFPFNYFNSRIDDAQDQFEIYGARIQLLQTGKDL